MNFSVTESEIQANKNFSLTGSEAGLAGYWNFSQGNCITVKDQTSNGNDGTIDGATWSN